MPRLSYNPNTTFELFTCFSINIVPMNRLSLVLMFEIDPMVNIPAIFQGRGGLLFSESENRAKIGTVSDQNNSKKSVRRYFSAK